MSLRQTLAVSMTALLLPVCVTAVRADDKADLDSTRIIGNRELPKVLYIVPWRQSAPGELLERPMPSVMTLAKVAIQWVRFSRRGTISIMPSSIEASTSVRRREVCQRLNPLWTMTPMAASDLAVAA